MKKIKTRSGGRSPSASTILNGGGTPPAKSLAISQRPNWVLIGHGPSGYGGPAGSRRRAWVGLLGPARASATIALRENAAAVGRTKDLDARCVCV